MSEGNNTKIIDACIEEFIKENQFSGNIGDIFEIFCGIQITKDYDLSSDAIQAAIVDGANDGGIDIFLPLLNENPISTSEDIDDVVLTKASSLELIIIQSKSEPSFREIVLDKLITSAPLIFDLAVTDKAIIERFNSSLAEGILAFRRAWLAVAKKGGKVSCKYFYATRANEVESTPAFNNKVEQLLQITKDKFAATDLNFNCISAKELFELYQASSPASRDLIFAANPMSMRYRDGIGYIGLARLKDFSKFIKNNNLQLEERIFESNVRHYQGDVDVNNRIKETLRDDKERDFWWVNNGITIVASSAVPLGDTLTLGSPQIVNGLQTSFSIGEAYKDSDADTRTILVKVIVSDDQETVDKVISSTNRQTSVQPASLRATDDVQRQLEAFFESKGYYYDRRKNYYRNRGKPISKIFGIQYTAQAIHSILNRAPAEARSKPTSLIKDEETYSSIFNPDKSYEAYLECCIIFRNARLILSAIPDQQSNILANYVFHLARVVTSFSTGKAVYSANDVARLYGKDLTEKFKHSASWLAGRIETFRGENPKMNVINIAKSRLFVEFINESLIKEFS